MKLIMMSIVLLIFSGCSWLEDLEPRVIIKNELVCVEQYIYPYSKKVKVRVHPDDLEIHQERARYLKLGYDFYKQQIDRNNKCLKGKNDDNKTKE